MDLTNRQAKILNSLIEEYLDSAEPISSKLLKERFHLTISPATIRNELQILTDYGYVEQPHTSAGRVPTPKAYRYFVDIIITEPEPGQLIAKEIENAKHKIQKELELLQDVTKSLQEILVMLNNPEFENKDTIFEILTLLGPSQASYDKNMSLIEELLREFENF